MKSVDKNNNQVIRLPYKERVRIKYRKIRALYRMGYSYEEVVREMRELGESVSKTTVFFAVNGRATKKKVEMQKIRRQLKLKTKNTK